MVPSADLKAFRLEVSLAVIRPFIGWTRENTPSTMAREEIMGSETVIEISEGKGV